MSKLVLRHDRGRSDPADGPWIRRDRIARTLGVLDPREPVEVVDHRLSTVGWGLVSPSSKIAVRMLGFGAAAPEPDWLTRRIDGALAARDAHGFGRRGITGVREINSEGDGLPGLTVDRYGDVRVIVLATAAMVALEAPIVARLEPGARTRYVVRPEGVARWEGFEPGTARLGPEAPLAYEAHGLAFAADPPPAQKTGAFLDQRDNHPAIAELVADVDGAFLDLGCHLGGFAAQAARRGARVVALDASARALAGARETFARNGLPQPTWIEDDMFGALDRPELAGPFAVAVVDPPRLAPKRRDLDRAVAALSGLLARLGPRMARGGHLVVCSCSHHLDRGRLDAAVLDAGLRLARVGERGAGPDHPIAPGHREGEYLRVNVYQCRG